MKIGGGGAERFMMTLPLLVALFMTVYALGGPDRDAVHSGAHGQRRLGPDPQPGPLTAVPSAPRHFLADAIDTPGPWGLRIERTGQWLVRQSRARGRLGHPAQGTARTRCARARCRLRHRAQSGRPHVRHALPHRHRRRVARRTRRQVERRRATGTPGLCAACVRHSGARDRRGRRSGAYRGRSADCRQDRLIGAARR